jgi:hypothetical protein
MVMVRIIFALLFGMSATVAAHAEIFKWVDKQGNVHFGDCPPADCHPQEVTVDPGPSQQTIEEARHRAEQPRTDEKTERKSAESQPEQEGADSMVRATTGQAVDPPCFSTLQDAWGGRIADTREAVSRKVLTDREYRQLQELLRSFAGRWRGVVEEMTCIRPEATPPTKTDRYRLGLNADWTSSNILEIEANQVGLDNKSVRREFFWLLASEEGLRFRKAYTDIVSDIDQPRYDVEPLMVSSDVLRIFWRRGGTQRRVGVFELLRQSRSYRIREFYYVQGTLVGKRSWELHR